MAQNGPVIFEALNDSFSGNAVIKGIVWKYSGATLGDEVVLTRTGGGILWEGLADTVQVYQGGMGLDLIVEDGFSVTTFAGGKLFIYLKEEF